MARYDPNGPVTLDMFPEVERLPRQAAEPEISITCPVCRASRSIVRREWINTQQARIKKFREWDGSKWITYEDLDPESGVRTPIHCANCGSAQVASEWHRVYEREQLALTGVITPRMKGAIN